MSHTLEEQSSSGSATTEVLDPPEGEEQDSGDLATEIEAALEAILFVSSEPVPLDRLAAVFRQRDRPLVDEALDRLRHRYRPTEDEPSRGLILDEAAGGFRLVTRPDLHGHLRKYFEVTGSTRLSMPALETLAIVAYRQPITLPEIQELRGKSSSGVIKTLLERRLIRISGRKDVVGKPFLYSTTRDFLLHFGLGRVEDLPPLEEFEETFGADGPEGGDLDGEDREEQVLQQLAIVEEDDEEQHEEQERREIETERLDAESAESTEESGDEGDEAAPPTTPTDGDRP